MLWLFTLVTTLNWYEYNCNIIKNNNHQFLVQYVRIYLLINFFFVIHKIIILVDWNNTLSFPKYWILIDFLFLMKYNHITMHVYVSIIRIEIRTSSSQYIPLNEFPLVSYTPVYKLITKNANAAVISRNKPIRIWKFNNK